MVLVHLYAYTVIRLTVDGLQCTSYLGRSRKNSSCRLQYHMSENVLYKTGMIEPRPWWRPPVITCKILLCPCPRHHRFSPPFSRKQKKQKTTTNATRPKPRGR